MEELKELLISYLKSKNIKLDFIGWVKEFNVKTLQVLLYKKEGITIDELEEVNNYLSKILDKVDISTSPYTLEVSSSGAIREIKDDEINDYLNKYISIKTNDNNEEKGYLLENNENDLLLKINIKGRIKNIKVDKKNIKKINSDIKF